MPETDVNDGIVNNSEGDSPFSHRINKLFFCGPRGAANLINNQIITLTKCSLDEFLAAPEAPPVLYV